MKTFIPVRSQNCSNSARLWKLQEGPFAKILVPRKNFLAFLGFCQENKLPNQKFLSAAQPQWASYRDPCWSQSQGTVWCQVSSAHKAESVPHQKTENFLFQFPGNLWRSYLKVNVVFIWTLRDLFECLSCTCSKEFWCFSVTYKLIVVILRSAMGKYFVCGITKKVKWNLSCRTFPLTFMRLVSSFNTIDKTESAVAVTGLFSWTD